MNEKYMLDSSVWIRYFRDKDYELTPLIKELLERDVVYMNGIIQTELLKGAKSEKNYRVLKNIFNGLHFLEIDRNLFDSISEASFILRRKGITVPLSDLIIAIHCVESNLILIEEDKHFKFIKEYFNLKIHQLKVDNIEE
ncbi:MAG: PIN domain-containing protein [Candidatus Aminicenantes bacterium]|nr:PIN domain-containing protein [Candidatus Aminicenantes bacterium]